jgi:hypothetical protein
LIYDLNGHLQKVVLVRPSLTENIIAI